MNTADFGPFASIVGVAAALVATFAYLGVQMVGRIQKWTWLTDNPPTFLTLVPARVVAVVVMAMAYLDLNHQTYWIFVGLAVAFALAGALAVFRFDHLRRLHVLSIEQVGPDGRPLSDRDGRTVVKRVIVGTEQQLRPQAARDLEKARQTSGSLSVKNFMAGYGRPLNDPSNLWDDTTLARLGSQLTRAITFVVLCGVLALYLAALLVARYSPA